MPTYQEQCVCCGKRIVCQTDMNWVCFYCSPKNISSWKCACTDAPSKDSNATCTAIPEPASCAELRHCLQNNAARHRVLLAMLQTVDELFTGAKIPYWLCGGTLMGVERHRGFIPHDDDMCETPFLFDYHFKMHVI